MHEIWMIIAVIVAPFLAVFAQRQLDNLREIRGRRLAIFKSLMATRAAILSPEHVQALNMIDLEFTGNKYKDIRIAWKEYLDHLGSQNALDLKQREENLPTWGAKRDDLLAKLLQEMGKRLGYKFDPVQVKRGIYSPQGHADVELEQNLLRRWLLEVLAGKRELPINAVISPLNDEAAAQGKRMMDGLVGVLEGERSLKYQLDQGDNKRVDTNRLPATSSDGDENSNS